MGESFSVMPSTRMSCDFQKTTKLGRIPSMPAPLPKWRRDNGTWVAMARGGD